MSHPSPRCSYPNSWNLRMLSYIGKRDFADEIKDLEMRRYPGLSRRALNVITSICTKERKRGRDLTAYTQRDVTSEAESGVMQPGAEKCGLPLKGKRQRTDSPSGASRRNRPC